MIVILQGHSILKTYFLVRLLLHDIYLFILWCLNPWCFIIFLTASGYLNKCIWMNIVGLFEFECFKSGCRGWSKSRSGIKCLTQYKTCCFCHPPTVHQFIFIRSEYITNTTYHQVKVKSRRTSEAGLLVRQRYSKVVFGDYFCILQVSRKWSSWIDEILQGSYLHEWGF